MLALLLLMANKDDDEDEDHAAQDDDDQDQSSTADRATMADRHPDAPLTAGADDQQRVD